MRVRQVAFAVVSALIIGIEIWLLVYFLVGLPMNWFLQFFVYFFPGKASPEFAKILAFQTLENAAFPILVVVVTSCWQVRLHKNWYQSNLFVSLCLYAGVVAALIWFARACIDQFSLSPNFFATLIVQLIPSLVVVTAVVVVLSFGFARQIAFLQNCAKFTGD